MIVTAPAFLDACVLIPVNLTDVLLRSAGLHAFRPLWSAQVLDEVRRNLPRASATITPERATRRVAAMRTAFPQAEGTDYEWLMPVLTNAPEDRHVLAAAVHGGAEVIVTANLDDFRPRDLREHGVAATHPDAFLVDLLDEDPELISQCLRDAVLARRRPPDPIDSLPAQLGEVVPDFAEAARRSMR